ncbi:hypothetical protein [Prolixibacter sp. NT017]|uniref:GldL-related protein n=1 Tax=Prolixibacter sp. NT017 TaxID=2652390 RepID=UPI001271E9FE|nr:hypothetical protein [Prolixibacter sp. NT017]GET26142.1 hypothetical protein NT017_24710 [Prolixibacter sp. NT017]
MRNKRTETLLNILYNTSWFLVLAGALFKLQHWPYGTSLLWFGFIFGSIISSIQNMQLKKRIRELEAKIPPIDDKDIF